MAGEHVLVIDDSPTILKVVELTLTKAGYRVTIAADGEEGVDKALAERPDLILLDFVMPKMNGYQVCRALGKSDALYNVPVILMSAKGEQVGERFVKVMGIVEYITKPFSPDALEELVRRTFLTRPAHANAQMGNAHANENENANANANANENENANANDAHDKDAVLTGVISAVPLPDVLALLGNQRQTGVFEATRDGATLRLAFDKGRIDLALGDGLGEELLFGRFVIDASTMSRQDLDLFLGNSNPTSAPLGARLVKMGYVSESERDEALARQTKERVLDLLRWQGGRFRFVAGARPPALATSAHLQLSVDELLLEGQSRVDEWHLLERELEDFETIFLRNEEAIANLQRSGLSRRDLSVLELVNGKNTVKEVARGARMATFEVARLLFRLLHARIIRRRVAPVAT